MLERQLRIDDGSQASSLRIEYDDCSFTFAERGYGGGLQALVLVVGIQLRRLGVIRLSGWILKVSKNQ